MMCRNKTLRINLLKLFIQSLFFYSICIFLLAPFFWKSQFAYSQNPVLQTNPLSTYIASSETLSKPSPDLSLSIEYQGSFFGFPVMKDYYQFAFYGQQYVATSRFLTAGLIRWFKKANIQSKSYGTFSSTGVQPTQYEHKNLASKKNRTVRILFYKDQVKPDIHPPFGSLGNPAPTPAQLKQSIDPLSASVLLALRHRQKQDLCKKTYTLFDGKLLYTLQMVNKGQEHIKTKAYKGMATRCHIYYKPVAGFDPEDLPKIDISNKPATLWLANFDTYSVSVPIKISFRIKGWRGIIEAKSLTLTGKKM